MATISIEEFEKIINDAVQSLPHSYDLNLNGAYHIEENQKVDDDDYYILGEYIEEPYLGRFIVLYYGSFVELLKHATYVEWEEEVKDTIWHELQHHLESLAGNEELAKQEENEKRNRQSKNNYDEPPISEYSSFSLILLITFLVLIIYSLF